MKEESFNIFQSILHAKDTRIEWSVMCLVECNVLCGESLITHFQVSIFSSNLF